MREARAEQGRIEKLLARTELRADFDGVVVSGDLSQRLRAPVRRGEVLYEIAPLDAYRINIQVDEGDVGWVELGQQGTLVLSALPHERFPFEVSKLTPVAEAEEGRNTFRVEAQLQDELSRLRPGEEGIAKIDVGQRRLLWIWTRGAANWVRLKLWTLLP
jgi:multidrug resistance efflux pump